MQLLSILIEFIVFICIAKHIYYKLNKIKKDKVNPNNYNPDVIEKTPLYKIFVKVSTILLIGLLPFVYILIYRFPDVYPADESSSGSITLEIAHKSAIFVWPILVIYIFMFILLVINKTPRRKTYYPLALITFVNILLNLAIVYVGPLALFYIVLLMWPVTILAIILSSIGNKLDKKQFSTKQQM